MKTRHKLFAASFAMLVLSPTIAMAEGWFINSFFHYTTTADCMNKAAAAFKGIAGTIQRGKEVVYGYDLEDRDSIDAIIICQRPRGANKEEDSRIAVVFVLYDRRYTKKSRRIDRRLKDRIVERYKDSM